MNIKNGIITLNNIDGVPFKVDLIPKSNKTSRPQRPMIPRLECIHNTGNSRKGANAIMHTNYVDNTNKYISWHFTVDDKIIYQELPINECGFHAGDGRGRGNRASIGIEICEQEGIDWQKAKLNAIKLITFLIDNVETLENNPVKPHHFFSGKYCPHRILDEGWNKFLISVNDYSINNKKEEKVLTMEDLRKALGISKNEWSEKYIDKCKELGLISGSHKTDELLTFGIFSVVMVNLYKKLHEELEQK